MVVVGVGAAPVDRLAVLGPQYVHLAGVRELLQGAVDRGQPDGVAALFEQIVDLLRAERKSVKVASTRRRPAAAGSAERPREQVGAGQCSS